jgi:hypothetical protein
MTGVGLCRYKGQGNRLQSSNQVGLRGFFEHRTHRSPAAGAAVEKIGSDPSLQRPESTNEISHHWYPHGDRSNINTLPVLP